MKGVFIFYFALITVSCSPQARFSRLIKKNPELIEKLTTIVEHRDTVYFDSVITVRDTFYAPALSDTFFIKNNRDTTIVTDKYKLTKKGNEYKLDISADTFYFEKEIFVNDTIYIQKKIRTEAKVIKESKSKKWFYFILGCIVALLWIYFSRVILENRK